MKTDKVTDLEKYKKAKKIKELIYKLVLSGHKSLEEFRKMYPPEQEPKNETD